MGAIGNLLGWAIDIFRIILLTRVLIEWIRALNPSFQPKGVILVIAEVSFMLTDWIVKPLSRLIKPIRIGGGYLDLSILVLFIALGIIRAWV
ncbi:MAG: YggT family protein [Rhodoluna sp.]